MPFASSPIWLCGCAGPSRGSGRACPGLARLARTRARTASRPRPGCPRNGRQPARTWPGRCRTAGDPDRWSSAITSTCRTPPGPARRSRSASCASTPTPASCCGNTATTCSRATCRPHRLAWSSPASIPSTGNVFAISGERSRHVAVEGRQAAVGTLARRRDRACGRRTADGCRSPIIDGDQLDRQRTHVQLGPVSPAGAHRFISFDKSSGQIRWVSAPEGRPTDTIYANPYVADVNGTRMFFSGGSDGAMHAIKVATGEPVWHWNVSKRGLNTAALMIGSDVIVTHSEENMDGNEMGMLAAVPAASKGTLTDKDARWLVRDVQAGYGSPVSDGQRIYIVDNGGVLFAFDVKDGKQLWRKNLGTIQKSSPVLADGKLYVGTENGKFYILKPRADGVDVLDEDEMPAGVDGNPQPIIASPAVARGRVYVVTMEAMYAIGPKARPRPAAVGGRSRMPRCRRRRPRGVAARDADRADPQAGGAGHARAFAASTRTDSRSRNPPRRRGRSRTSRARSSNGTFTRRPAAGAQAGSSRRRSGRSRVSVAHSRHPRSALDVRLRTSGETPPAQWVNATGKFAVRDARRQQGARQARGEPVRVRQAVPRVLGRPRLQQLHDRSRRPRDGEAPPARRRRHRRAALRDDAVRQPRADRAAAVAAGNCSARSRSTSRGRRTPGTR